MKDETAQNRAAQGTSAPRTEHSSGGGGEGRVRTSASAARTEVATDCSRWVASAQRTSWVYPSAATGSFASCAMTEPQISFSTSAFSLGIRFLNRAHTDTVKETK